MTAEGILYVVATPIGNLADISFRAIDVLKSVDYIAAEDTRHTARLLSHYQIQAKLVSCHEHNESEKAEFFAAKLQQGQSVALVSDAGTPSVSDPGYRVVSAAINNGIRVVPVPGASAAMAALSASGLPSDRFCFIGFLPKKKGKQQELLNRLADGQETLIFYESPKRIGSLLKTLQAILGAREAVLAREITKMHEEFIRGTLPELSAAIGSRPAVKGEIVLLVSGKADKSTGINEIPESAVTEIKTALLKKEASPSELASRISKMHHVPKNSVYKLILKLKAEMVK